MVLKKPVKKKALTKKIDVTKAGGKVVREVEIPISENREIQDGVSPKGKLMNSISQGTATIGLSIGATINMGDFQSARIDVFIQRNVEDNDSTIKDGYSEISEMLHEELQRQSAILGE